MKTFKEVKDNITTAFCSNSYMKEFYHLDDNKTFDEQFSVVSFESILFDVMAGIMFVVLQLTNHNQSEITDKINTLVPHNLSWYRTKALAFQFGFDLLPDSDKFDNGDTTDEEIEASKIIKQCAVSEVNGRLIIKVAKEFEALEPQELINFVSYMQEVKDAGVRLTIISTLPDKLKLGFVIRYNPLLLTDEGVSLLDGTEPVKNAVKNYLKKLPFDGELSLMKLVDAIQEAEGVQDLKINSAETCWVNDTGYNSYEDIYMSVIPKSGWFKEDLTINYEAGK